MDGIKPIFITMGDPGGIGAEITIKAWQQREKHSLPPFFLQHDPAYVRGLCQKFGWDIPLAVIDQPAQAAAYFATALPILPIDGTIPLALGHTQPTQAALIAASIKLGVDWCHAGQVSALVTNPIHKFSMQQGGFAYPGHTEYLGALCGQKPIMVLANDSIRVAPFTGHIPLATVSERVTPNAITDYLTRLYIAATRQLSLVSPRIAICGLNPHAGEDGALGREEQDIIIPALERLRQDGMAIIGPLSADTAFHAEARAQYDIIVGLYHDQVLIPVKTIDFWRSVNITLGLGIVRTSPDHGTALDIAVRGIARADSMIAAIQYTARLRA